MPDLVHIERRAPGKLLYFGEYVVLEGAPAIVSAADRYVSVRRVSAGDTLSIDSSLWDAPWHPAEEPAPAGAELCVSAIAALKRHGLSPPPGRWSIDSSSLGSASKYGLGSSGAVAAALCCAWAGDKLDDQQLEQLSHEAHRHFQGGEGSGSDVAASLHGGLLSMHRGTTPTPMPYHSSMLASLHVFTGKSADTRELVAAWRAWRAERAETSEPLVDRLKQLSTLALAAFEDTDHGGWLDLIDEWTELCRRVQADGGPEIISREVDTALQILNRFGYAAKASGAGGGDIVLGFAKPNADPAGAERGLASAGLHILDIEIAPTGALHELGSR